MGPLEARRSRITILVGIIGLAVLGAVFYVTFTIHEGLPLQEKTMVKAAFKDVDSLSAGDEVRQNSVRIGRVDSVELKDGVAVATLQLDGNKKVYADARAEIWDFSALGAKFVELDPGNPEAGRLEGRIPAKNTVDSADIHEVFDVFDKSTRQAAASSARELGSGAAGHGGDLNDYLGSAPDLLPDLGTVSKSLASPDADLPALLRSADRLSARFVGREEHITRAIEQSADTLQAFSVDDAQPLTGTLRRLPRTLDSTNMAFAKLDAPLADLKGAFAKLEPGAEGLSAAEDDLRGVFRESDEALGKLPGVAEQAEPAVEDLTKTIADARPLAPKVSRAFDDLVTPMRVLAPYAREAGQLFVRGHSFVSENINGLHYARLLLAPSPVRTAGGGLVTSDAQPRNPYPEPGEADHDRAGAPTGGDR